MENISEKATQPSFIPQRKFTRNEYGLINDGSVNYVYNDDGTINWRKMINPIYLVPNKQRFEARKQPVPQTIDGLEDKDLIILLGGIKELAQIRGFFSVNHFPVVPNSDMVVSSCSITWIPNYETSNQSVTFSAIGDATPNNTNLMVRNFLGPIAENRAFVRAVRNFLKINIVGQEELGGNGKPEEQQLDSRSGKLQDTMTKYGVSFEVVKNKLIEEYSKGEFKLDDGAPTPDTYTSISDIPSFKQFELIDRIITRAAQKSS